MWDDWQWSLHIDPMEHLLTFVCGFLCGTFMVALPVLVIFTIK